jgi:gamma-glutamyltranspeptidase/glutathione hydrolase
MTLKRSVSFLLLTVLGGYLFAEPIIRPASIYRPVKGTSGMVVAAEPLAAEAGLNVLKAGGNAMDAAVATAFSLAVTLPRAGNLGGGGFLLYYEAESETVYALDFRETAPLGAERDMFLDKDGAVDSNLSRNSALASGVPGTVAGLLEALERFGTMDRPTVVDPAIELAQKGFPVSEDLAGSLAEVEASGRLSEEARKVYFAETGAAPLVGTLLKQEDLAQSLRKIREDGKEGFYQGKIAEAILSTLVSGGSSISAQDFEEYTPVWREPVSGQYHDKRVHSMPPPSSGGTHLIQMLRLAELFPVSEYGHNTSQTIHLLCEIMKRAYADRSKHLGDPDFADIPVEELISDSYRDKILHRINTMMVTPSSRVVPGNLASLQAESSETTHLSVVDSMGNAVALTYTLNFSYGSGLMIPGTGILMNNQMDDFSSKPGVPNAYGLIGGEANAIEPRKRMLSSMTPTIVTDEDGIFIVTGSPGGSRIITTVFQVIMNLIDHGMNPAEANHAVRVHHQWLPDVLYLERGFPHESLRALEAMGYTIEEARTLGAAQTILRSEGVLYGSTDPRRGGAAMGY